MAPYPIAHIPAVVEMPRLKKRGLRKKKKKLPPGSRQKAVQSASRMLGEHLVQVLKHVEVIRLQEEALQFLQRSLSESARRAEGGRVFEPLFQLLAAEQGRLYKELFMWGTLIPGAVRKKAQVLALRDCINQYSFTGSGRYSSDPEKALLIKAIRIQVQSEKDGKPLALKAALEKAKGNAKRLDDEDRLQEVEDTLKGVPLQEVGEIDTQDVAGLL